MGVPGNADLLLLKTAAAAGGYQVSRSLRFNAGDSAFLSKSFGSAGNSRTFTFSAWVKRNSSSSTLDNIFGAGTSTSSPSTRLYFYQDKLAYQSYTGSANDSYIETSQVFRDYSAWYHITLSVDTTNGTADNRQRLYVNGTEVTAFSSRTNHSLNADTYLNRTTYVHEIGRTTLIGSSSYIYANFQLADIWFLDGIAATPSDFAETDATTGQWIPKAYTGSKGTNGFHLEFADNSAATATTLGKDTSGNGLNWTPNNFSVTAGAGNDSLTDTPTSYGTDTGAGGEVRGNYATLNPLEKGTNVTLSNGNLDATNSVAQNDLVKATIGMSSGKWYAEFLVQSQNSSYATPRIGLAGRSAPVTNDDFGNAANEYAFGVTNNSSLYGRVYNNGSWSGTATAVYPNDIAMCAFDADTGKMWFGVNGTWFNSGNPAAGTNPWFTASMTEPYFFTVHNISTSVVCNFGARAFSYQAPSGFKALCDTNLPAPVVAKPNTVFDVKLWTGNGGTQTISGLNFSPDFVFLKCRSNTRISRLVDTVRGATKILFSSLTNAEETDANSLTAFNSDGFTLGSSVDVNESSQTFVGWVWDAGSSTVTNTQGSITSSVRANTSAGFSIVTWTGNGTSGATVGHGLNVTPSFYIVKNRSNAWNWAVYHSSLGNTKAIFLNLTDAPDTGSGYWNNAGPSSTTITLGAASTTNQNTANMVAYVFSPVAGYSSAFSFTGTGSTDGPLIWLGFRARMILLKRTDISGDRWVIWDTARNIYNQMTDGLFPNLSNAELNGYDIDVLANGFKMRDSESALNASGGTYVGFAWAESPFQYARAR